MIPLKSCTNCIKQNVCEHATITQSVFRSIVEIQYGGTNKGIEKLSETIGEYCRFYSGEGV